MWYKTIPKIDDAVAKLHSIRKSTVGIGLSRHFAKDSRYTYTDRHTIAQRQIKRKTVSTGRQTREVTYRWTDGLTDERTTDRQMGRWAYRRIDRQADRQNHRKTDVWTI
jgi:hypothetical protein